MTLIEGVGDEVTFFAIFLLVFILFWTVIFTSRTISLISVETNSTLPDASIEQETEEIIQEENSESQIQSCNGGGTVFSELINDVSAAESDSVEGDKDAEQLQCTETMSTEETVKESCQPPAAVSTDNRNQNSPSAPEASPLDDDHENLTTLPGQIRVRLKYLDDTDRTVMSFVTEKIGDFKRINFPEDLANNKIVRLIYNGQLLNDHFTLGSYGIDDNCVVHIHISQARIPQGAPVVNPNADLDLSHLLWPLISVILGIIWVLYFKYPEFFSMMSVGILFLFTGSFIFFYSMVQQQQ